MLRRSRLIVLFVICNATAWPALAEVRRAGGDQDAMAHAQYMLQQMGTERDALKAENAKLQGQIDKQKTEMARLKKEQSSTKERLKATGDEVARYKEGYKTLMERFTQTRTKFQQVIDKFRETINSLRQVEAERNQLKTSLQDRTHEVESCMRKNIDLYNLDLELVDKYNNKGVMAALFQMEPVTGLKKVDVQNAVEAYRSRIESLKADRSAQQSSAN